MTLLLAEMGIFSVHGPSLDTTLASLARGDRALTRTKGFIGSDFKEQLCAFVQVDPLWDFEEALPALVEGALNDLLARLPTLQTLPVHCILCVPEPVEHENISAKRIQDISELLAQQISNQMANSPLQIKELRVAADGQAGPARVLESIFARNANEAFLLICADSLADRARMSALLNQRRLFSKESVYGLIPGEAAAAMLLLPEHLVPSEPLGMITSAATAQENIGELDNADSMFTGLSDAALAALDMLGPSREPVNQVLTDFNNGRYRAGEGAYCIHRLTYGYLGEDVAPVFPAIAFGDTGAAYLGTALIHMIVNAFASSKPIQALALASTTHSKTRGAVVFQTNPGRLKAIESMIRKST